MLMVVSLQKAGAEVNGICLLDACAIYNEFLLWFV